MTPILLAAGYLNVDITASVGRIPDFGERVTALSVVRSFGGMTANAACAASRLGLRTEFFGRVGKDPEGEAALAELRSFGVGTRWVSRSSSPTTTALVLLGPDGERAIVSEPMKFDYAPLEEAIEQFAGWDKVCVHLDGYRLPEALPVLWQARRLGLYTSADLDGFEAANLSTCGADVMSSLDVVVLNSRLAGMLASTPVAAAEELVGLGAEVVVVTLGKEGALVAHGKKLLRVRAPRVEVRDTTGAGDVFVGAFLTGWLGGEGTEGAAKLAVAAGAVSVTGVGARGHLPDRKEVEGIIRSVVVEEESLQKGRKAR